MGEDSWPDVLTDIFKQVSRVSLQDINVHSTSVWIFPVPPLPASTKCAEQGSSECSSQLQGHWHAWSSSGGVSLPRRCLSSTWREWPLWAERVLKVQPWGRRGRFSCKPPLGGQARTFGTGHWFLHCPLQWAFLSTPAIQGCMVKSGFASGWAGWGFCI